MGNFSPTTVATGNSFLAGRLREHAALALALRRNDEKRRIAMIVEENARPQAG